MSEWTVYVDTREKYPYRLADRPVTAQRRALPAGDYAVIVDDAVVAAVERKTLGNLSADLVSGKIGFVMAELSTLSAAAAVVEDRYTSIVKSEHVEAGWPAELVARLQVRYPRVPIVFCYDRKFAEEWTYRFLGGPGRVGRRLRPGLFRLASSRLRVGTDAVRVISTHRTNPTGG